MLERFSGVLKERRGADREVRGILMKRKAV